MTSVEVKPVNGFTVYYPGPQRSAQRVQLCPGFTAEVLVWGHTEHGLRLPRYARVEVAPQARVPRPKVHLHSAEEIEVTSGVLQDENGRYPAGTLIRAERGTQHSPFSQTGCSFTLYCPDLLAVPPEAAGPASPDLRDARPGMGRWPR